MKAYEIQSNLDAVQALAEAINDWGHRKGFWNSPFDGQEIAYDWYKELINMKKSQKLLLIVSEVIECMEGLRKHEDSTVPGFTNEEEEIADAIIRLLDYSAQYKLRIGDALGAKMLKNEGRMFMHGKTF